MGKYKLKKKFKLLFIIIIIGIICSLVMINLKGKNIKNNNTRDNNNVLSTVKIKTNLDMNDFSNIIYKIENNTIKYVVQNKNSINFYSYDISTKKEEVIGILNDYDYCYDDNNEDIVCYKNSEELESNGDYFSFDMKKINKKIIVDEDNYSVITKTSKGIVKQSDKELYLGNKKVTNIDDLGNVLEVFETENDLFYLFSNLKNYTVLRNSNLEKTKLSYSSYYKYNDGYIFRTGNEYAIFNLKDNNLNKYNYDSIEEDGEYYNNLIYKDELIVIDSNSSRIVFEKSKTGEMFIYDVEAANKIFNAKTYDNYLIFIGNNNDYPSIYILNLDLLKKEYILYKDYTDKLSIENVNTIKRIKDNYNVNILVKKDYKNDFGDFKVDYNENEECIKKSLSTIENTLSEYKKETFDYFIDEKYTGLYIFIVDHVKSAGDLLDFTAEAFTLEDDDKHLIVVDRHSVSDSTLKHELMHSFDRTLIENKQDRIDFENYNPKDFNYTLDYNISGNQEYIKRNDEASDSVYFPNGYGTTNRQEDVATIYESVCALNIDLKKYPKIEKKYNYIKETMIKHIPGISESKCFKN